MERKRRDGEELKRGREIEQIGKRKKRKVKKRREKGREASEEKGRSETEREKTSKIMGGRGRTSIK